MGCDIHGPWVFGKPTGRSAGEMIAELDWDRNYEVFAIIADVRNDGDDPRPPVSQPKGFPPGGWFAPWGRGKYILEEHGSRSDCHSMSWLSTDELVEAQRRYVADLKVPDEDMMLAIQIMRFREQQGWADLRLIFCFDN